VICLSAQKKYLIENITCRVFSSQKLNQWQRRFIVIQLRGCRFSCKRIGGVYVVIQRSRKLGLLNGEVQDGMTGG
jgi:hypothetical protein